jgi:hypothetical protein
MHLFYGHGCWTLLYVFICYLYFYFWKLRKLFLMPICSRVFPVLSCCTFKSYIKYFFSLQEKCTRIYSQSSACGSPVFRRSFIEEDGFSPIFVLVPFIKNQVAIKKLQSQAQGAHSCNTSYSGGRDQKDWSSKLDHANRSQDPVLKISNTKSASGVAQSIDPEFKPHYFQN